MYCHKCGRPTEPHYTGICGTCSAASVSLAELSERLKKAKAEKKKKDDANFVIVLLLGFLCPLIWLIYFISKHSDKLGGTASVLKSFGFGFGGDSKVTFSEAIPAFSDGSEELPEREKEFYFIGGDGNIYKSGGLFCDWSKNYVNWGTSFRDKRNNLIAWGQPFYDNRDNYIIWGSPFYDSGDNYVDPRG